MLLLTACGASTDGDAVAATTESEVAGTGLDYEKLENEIAKGLDKTFDKLNHKVSSVTCEQPEDVKPGDKFRCIADVGGNDVRTEVEVKDADFTVHWETIDYLYKSTTIGHMLSDEVSKEVGTPVNVVCGKEVFIVVPVGGTYDCSATSVHESKSGTVVVTPKNADSVDWKLVGW